jgi:hypothetical protein
LVEGLWRGEDDAEAEGLRGEWEEGDEEMGRGLSGIEEEVAAPLW